MINSDRDSARSARDLAVVCALVILVTAFNLTKADHMDDGAHLAIARAILKNPLHPMSASFNWDQVAEPIHVLNQPHLFFYLMAGVMALTHDSDLALHLLEAVWAAAALFLFHRLAKLLAPRRALLATALLALGPALLPSNNLMVDVPVLALWMGFLGSMAKAARSERTTEDWQACAFAAAACVVKYSSLLLLPLFVILAARRRAWKSLWALALPIAVLGAWSAFNWLDYGGIHLLGRRLGSGAPGEDLGTVLALTCGRFPFWLVGLGAAAPFAPFLAAGLLRSGSIRKIAALCGAAALAVGLAGVAVALPDLPALRDLQPIDALLRGVFFGNGLLILLLLADCLRRQARAARTSVERADIDLLAGSLAVAAAAAVVLAPFPAVRHVLLAIPAVLLTAFREPALARGRWWAAGALAATCSIGFAVAAADMQYADVYRREAPVLARTAPGRSVWYVGHWGWDVYAARSGMRPYEPGTSALQDGDALVMPELVHQQAITTGDRSRLVLERTQSIPSNAWSVLRTVTPAGGFYYFWGAVPWTFRTGPLEQFRIYSVRARGTAMSAEISR